MMPVSRYLCIFINVGLGEGANWVMLPGGMIIQRVYLGFPIGTNVRHITFPRSF
ncbi:TPA: phage tail protein, partial [Escherichia coli]